MTKVLIVDDASFARISLKMILEKNGFQIVGEAANGIEAIEKYKELRPDVVTMDITMPEMTGIEALKLIKDYDSKAKVAMVSAMGQELMVREAVANGANTFIVKPYKEDHIIKNLNKALEI